MIHDLALGHQSLKMGDLPLVRFSFHYVIPAQAGIQV
jgi:hypothetical protein